MRNPKIGLMAISCPIHVEGSNDIGESMVDKTRVALIKEQLIDKLNLEIINVDYIIDSPEKTFDVLKFFNSEEVDCIMIHVTTFVWANQYLQALRLSNVPIALLSESRAQGLPTIGLTVMHGALEQIGIDHAVFYGDIYSEELLIRIKRFALASKVKSILQKSRFGLFGGRSLGITTGTINQSLWMKKFGIDVEHFDQYSVVLEAEKIPNSQVRNFYNDLGKRFGKIAEFEKRFENSIRLYFGYKKILEKEKIDFSAIKCIFDLSDNYSSACLAQSLLNEEGKVSACCGDANAALTMYIMRNLSLQPMLMGDIMHVDPKNKLLRLMADGAASPSLAISDNEVTLNYQSEVESKAGGICVTLVGKPGNVTIGRFAEKDGYYILHIATGKAYVPDKNLVFECGYPEWPQIYIELESDPISFINNSLGQYTICCYDEISEELKETAGLLKIPVLES
jgi:L-fucose isomerase